MISHHGYPPNQEDVEVNIQHLHAEVDRAQALQSDILELEFFLGGCYTTSFYFFLYSDFFFPL